MTIRLRSTAAAALLLTACGCAIPDTAGAVKSGKAATGIESGTRLYFLSPQGIRLTIRPGTEREGLQQTLDTLMAGPTRTEQHTGLGTALPASGKVTAAGEDGTVTLRLSWPTSALSPYAIQQLVCTAEDAPATTATAPRIAVVSSDAPGPVFAQCDLHHTG
ncbi:GerMN domain-containing protein [Kitasatospora sp. NPDC091276]|uniref:GerMN domain-containing protein n=1 Tax=Kitasatospora sp. NPDC091276 TaxID=3155300 RepID=UPI00341BE1BF